MLLNEGRDPFEGPSLVGIAMRTGPLAEQSNEVVPLCQSEFGDTAWVALRIEPGFPMVVTGIAPAANRAGRRVQMAGHLAYSPTFLEEGHGHTTTDFQLWFGACGSPMTLIGIAQQFL
jgi:hypothetical protein